MHRLPSSSAVRRIRLTALLFCIQYLIAPAAGVLAWSLIFEDRKLAGIGISALILVCLIIPWQWLIATRANCPLCMTPVLANKGCAKHRSARTFCGSHRLRVALAALLLSRFRCPYCGEHSELKVRSRKPQ
jgi:endogenous inhibitor of DNA gyrase (YacG/DUF329 family)